MIGVEILTKLNIIAIVTPKGCLNGKISACFSKKLPKSILFSVQLRRACAVVFKADILAQIPLPQEIFVIIGIV